MSASLLLHPLLEALPLGVVAFDPSGRLHFANLSARELLLAPDDAVERGLNIGVFLQLDPRAGSLPAEAYGPPEEMPRVCVRLEELRDLAVGLRCVLVRPHTSPSDALEPHVAMLGHELRNPLAPLQLAARALREGGAEPAAACLAIERNVEQLSKIVDDLLDTERATNVGISLDRRPMLLRDAVADAVDACRPLFEEHRHTLTSDLVGLAGVEVDGDRTRLAQAVSNLLANAAAYAPRNGDIVLRGWQVGTTAHVAVTDDGAGLPTGTNEYIFDTFVRTAPATPQRAGLGLGLGLSRHIVMLHGGTIDAASPGLGRGSTFTLKLPNVRTMTREAPPPTTSSGEAATVLVLIVDDNEDAGAMLALVLESQGATCTVVHTGLAGVSAAQGTRFDLAIVDIGLPDIDGFEVARRAHALETRPNRIVALSGYGQQSDRDTAKDAGFDAYYVKPLAPEALLALLDPG